ncbi:MAG: dipeptidase [Planctomycetota bacterium]|nr:dipeptidase [Planctomycetota bacterium]
MPNLEAALKYAGEHREKFRDDLIELVRIPSVSTDPGRAAEMKQAAEWCAAQLRGLGFRNAAVLPTARHPVVYAEHLAAGPGKPTILFYDHYDVQPPEPLDEWETPPFEPTVRGENLYARGASDSKGQLVAHLKAVEALVKSGGGNLPVNLKYMLEGEEEIGSPSLPDFMARERERLKSDFCLNGDSGILGADRPGLCYALRGLAYFEIRLSGPARDLHSGLFGGAVHNPAEVLANLLAGMKDAQGRVTLPGFYEDVRELSAEERADLARVPQDEAWWLAGTGAPALWGEAGYTPTERATARPTLEVNGLLSGFTGTGSKTVLPSRAMAKLSMRLVADQDPAKVKVGLERYLKEHAPPSVRWELLTHAAARPSIVERDSREARAAGQALEAAWGRKPIFFRQGGTIPAVAQIEETLGLKSLLMGFGLPDDNLHAPNEKVHLPTFQRGVEAHVRFMSLCGKA